MGVHYLFPWIQQFCSECVSVNSGYKSPCVLLFDLNGLLYQKTDQTPEEACEYVMTKVGKKILDTGAEIAVLALDGVCPKAKRWQQRKRRYLSPLNNHISVGTDFMKRLDQEFVKRLEKKRLCKTVYFSGSGAPGEGEHKLVKFIRKFNWDMPKYIFGIDGDLLILSLLLPQKEIFVIRPVFMKPSLEHFVCIDSLKHYLCNRFFNIETFVIFSCLLGNDFLPSVEPHDTKEGFEQFLKSFQHVCLVEKSEILWHRLGLFETASEEGQSFAVGAEWFLKYYKQEKDSEKIDWYYKHNKRPSLENIFRPQTYSFSYTGEVEQSPAFQLFYILPTSSRHLLPFPLDLIHVETFTVEVKKRKKRPSWDVDYTITENGINLENIYRLLSFYIESEKGRVYTFQGEKQAWKPSASVKQV